MILKILAIVTMVVCGLVFVNNQWPVFGAAGSDIVAGDQPHSWVFTALAAAMVPVFFSYGGWHTTTFVAEEVREPRRTFSRALILGVGGVMALYVAVNFVCLRVLGVSELAKTKNPASDVMGIALGTPGAVFISIGIAISAIGFLSQATLTSPRVYYAMAKDRLFFKSVAWVHPRTRVPVIAIALQGAFAMIIAVSGTFEQIVKYILSVEMIFWSLTALGLFVIRRREAALPGSAELSMPGHPVTTLVFVLVNLAVLANLFYTDTINSLIGVGIALAGIPVYFFWRIVGRHGT
jgi:APA family basic amino acid/polyamine antiporter